MPLYYTRVGNSPEQHMDSNNSRGRGRGWPSESLRGRGRGRDWVWDGRRGRGQSTTGISNDYSQAEHSNFVKRHDVNHQDNSRATACSRGHNQWRGFDRGRGKGRATSRDHSPTTNQLATPFNAGGIAPKLAPTPVNSAPPRVDKRAGVPGTAPTNPILARLSNSIYAINKMNNAEDALGASNLPFHEAPFGDCLNDWTHETSTARAFPMSASAGSEIFLDGDDGVQPRRAQCILPTKISTLLADRVVPLEYKAQSSSFFFRLPPELRTKVYKLVFTTYRVEIARRRRSDKDGRNNESREESIKKEERNRCEFQLRSVYTSPRDSTQKGPHVIRHFTKVTYRKPEKPPLGLVFSCKAVYLETLFHLYSNTQFSLTSTRAVHDFLRETNPIAKTAIRHMELRHEMYNEPALTQHWIHKGRSDYSWYLACEAVSTTLTSLSVVHISLRIWDWPIKLTLDELWAKPILLFGNHGGLDYADVQLYMGMFQQKQLDDVAKQVEKAIMKPKSVQIKDDMKLAIELQALERPVSAPRVLTLRF